MNYAESSAVDEVVNAHDSLAGDIECVANGEFAALNRIHLRYGAKLNAICLRITGSNESAEDALQEVYIKVWNRAASYDRSLSRPIVWLGTIARNCAIDVARAQQRRQSATLPLDFDAIDETPPADDYLIEQERQVRAVALLEILAEQQRDHIRDIFLKGLTYADLSEQHGIPVGTIKSRIRRGLMTMKKAWKVD